MENNITKPFKKLIYIYRTIGLMMLVSFTLSLIAISVQAAEYGWLERSAEVDRKFKTSNNPTEYTYYYKGWRGEPDAVIGIKNGYTLNSDLWKPVDTEKYTVRSLVQWMFQRDSSEFHGSWIKDPSDNVMGIWYSDIEGATIKMAGPNEIAYISPQTGPKRPFKKFNRLFY